jgi:hypothetical protein
VFFFPNEGETMKISQTQYQTICGFFADLWCAYHQQSNFDTKWRDRMDENHIHWNIQNIVADLALRKENAMHDLRDLLERRDIFIV